jgi:hypothetical protein
MDVCATAIAWKKTVRSIFTIYTNAVTMVRRQPKYVRVVSSYGRFCMQKVKAARISFLYFFRLLDIECDCLRTSDFFVKIRLWNQKSMLRGWG